MEYKGYTIIAEINVNSQWQFDVTDNQGNIALTNHISDGEADEDNIADFLVQDPDGEDVDWRGNFLEAKVLVDQMVKADQTRKSRAGYVLGEKLTPFLENTEVLEVIKLRDRLAEIHNSALERSKRGQ